MTTTTTVHTDGNGITAVEFTRTIAIPNDGLRQLANVALFACTDRMVPTICAVRLRSDGWGKLTAEATDRYSIGREVIDLQYDGTPPDSFDVTVEIDGFIKATKIKHDRNSLPVTVTVNGDTILFDNGDDVARANLVNGDGYPPLERFLQPIDDPIQGEVTFGVSPQFLARLGKVRTENRRGTHWPAAVWTVETPSKPMQVRIEDTFTAVIMPVRVSS